MNNLFTYESLATLGGAAAATSVVVQFVKDMPPFKRLRTRHLVLVVAQFVMFGVAASQRALTWDQGAAIDTERLPGGGRRHRELEPPAERAAIHSRQGQFERRQGGWHTVTGEAEMAAKERQLTHWLATVIRHAAGRLGEKERRRSSKEVLLLDSPLLREDEELAVVDTLPADGNPVGSQVCDRILLRNLLGSLTVQEARVVYEVVLMQRPQAKVASELGLSQQRISQVRNHALAKLKSDLERRTTS